MTCIKRTKLRIGTCRKGVSIVETLLLIVVLLIAVWAVMSTAAWSTELQSNARGNIGMRIFASNWFSMLESLDPSVAFDARAIEVARSLDPNYSGDFYAGFTIGGYRVKPEILDSAPTGKANRGVQFISLTVSSSGSKGMPFSFVKRVNRYSSETVSDDKVGG